LTDMDLSRVLTSLLLLLCVDVTTSLDGNALCTLSAHTCISRTTTVPRY